MLYGIAKLLADLRGNSVPTQRDIDQQIAQGGGTDTARDTVARKDRRRRAMRLVGHRIAMKRLEDDSGVGRVAATCKKKK